MRRRDSQNIFAARCALVWRTTAFLTFVWRRKTESWTGHASKENNQRWRVIVCSQIQAQCFVLIFARSKCKLMDRRKHEHLSQMRWCSSQTVQDLWKEIYRSALIPTPRKQASNSCTVFLILPGSFFITSSSLAVIVFSLSQAWSTGLGWKQLR